MAVNGVEVIPMTVTDKVARCVGQPVIVCDNTDYMLDVSFDADWDDIGERVARFAFGEAGEFIDVAFIGNNVAIPKFNNITSVKVGFFCNAIATTAVKISCKRSVLSLGESEVVPPDGVYEQLLNTVDGIRAEIAAGMVKGDTGERGERGEQGEPGPAYDDTQLRADLARQISDAVGVVSDELEGMLNGAY